MFSANIFQVLMEILWATMKSFIELNSFSIEQRRIIEDIIQVYKIFNRVENVEPDKRGYTEGHFNKAWF